MSAEKPNIAARLTTGLLAVAVLAVLYVLSVGPVVCLCSQGYVSEDEFTILYYPLIVLTDNSATAERMVNSYIDLWCPVLPE